MKKTIAAITVLCAIIMLLSACGNGVAADQPSPSTNTKPTATTSGTQATPVSTSAAPVVQTGYPNPFSNLVLNASMTDHSVAAGKWSVATNASGACAFHNDGYYASAGHNSGENCIATGTDYGDFTYQIDLASPLTLTDSSSKLGIGDGGGVVFRNDNNTNKYLSFLILGDGSYYFAAYDPQSHQYNTISTAQLDANIWYRVITIGVVAQGNNITIYVNGQKIVQTDIGSSAPGYTHGQIGAMAEATSQAGMALRCTNVKVWTN